MAETKDRSPGSLSQRVQSLRLSDSSEGTGSTFWWLPWLLSLVLLFAVGLLALEAFSPIDDELIKKLAEERGLNVGKPASTSEALAKLGLPTSTGSAATEIALEAKGYIVPFSLVQVSPKITGTVMKLYIKEGIQVEKDAVLAELEDVEYDSDTKGAKARLEMLQRFRPDEIIQAKAELDDAVAQDAQMLLKYQRAIDLKKNNAIAHEEYEAAESSHKSMKERVRRLQIAYNFLKGEGPRDEQIANAKSELVKAQWRLDNTRVKAPIKGIILSKKTEEGNIVNPSAFSNGLSASLCEMADLHDLEVDLSIAERDLAKLFEKQDCRIRAEAFPNRIYPGYISRIMPMADRAKSAVPVRVKVLFPAVDAKGQPLPKDAQGEYLRPEMGAIVTFLNRKAPQFK
jgi:multidrug efflux pump subunit AcrA (membrane-fusion protein)